MREQYSYTDIDIKAFYSKILQMMTYTMLSGMKYLSPKIGEFETFAVDILPDDQLKPYLLEIN